MNTVRVGTRGSLLALTQTNQVIGVLQAHHPGMIFQTIVIKTTGDARQNVPFAAVGTKGMFVKEIEEALLAGEIDFAVHSMKDMPAVLPGGMEIAAVPERADPRDALLSNGHTLAQLPQGARIGTSSLRRQAQLRAARPDLVLEELRGNLDTRLRRLDEGHYDAIVLACAGLERLGRADCITERLPVDISVPAPGQGALALETRSDDLRTRNLLASLHHPATADAIMAERGFQAALNAGCTVPAGAHAAVLEGRLWMTAVIASPDGHEILRASDQGPREEATVLGGAVARILLERGGDEILRKVRS